ncbi:hypothetical protein Val02_28430 [Virgisporangium aliadipatigenens]|uniref:YbaB/EbfC DNA-binding family protein n=1 Tax=Virgisporangium aliadipatigenens TaxID=741659 RepID=A0A8J4DR42_9ACTN|nr:hypothetical protein Val02_28430 [Virgisporangium aliadipatigenens]
MADAIAALGQATNGTVDSELRGAGEALDGRITATAKPHGVVDSLVISPGALRLAPEALAEEILRAVNGALDDLRSKIGSALPGAPDTAALSAELRDIQERSTERMSAFLSAIETARTAARPEKR